MSPRIWLLAVLALVLAAASTEPAAAWRTARPAERAAIARVQGLPAACAVVRISTLRAGWAGFYGARSTRQCREWASDGVTVLRRRDGRWRHVVAGSSWEPCPLPRVPLAVARDLRACREASLPREAVQPEAVRAVEPLVEWAAARFDTSRPTVTIQACSRVGRAEYRCSAVLGVAGGDGLPWLSCTPSTVTVMGDHLQQATSTATEITCSIAGGAPTDTATSDVFD